MKADRKPVCAALNRALDHITILWTEPGKIATKQFSRASKRSEITFSQYDAGYLFTALKPIAINSIAELSEVLKFLEKQHRALVIRGAPDSDEIIGRHVTRTGSGEGINFIGNFRTPAAGRYYIEIDVDKYNLPPGWKLNQLSGDKICEHLVRLLPNEFHNASYHWQLSSSAGVFDNTKVSIHFWFWLTSPVPDADLKIWAMHVNAAAGFKLIDPSLFQHVQAHYTAAPIFKGLADPFPIRSGLVQKAQKSVSIVLPAPQPQLCSQPPQSSPKLASGGSAESGFEYFLSLIGDHSGGSGFHYPIIQAIASYVATHGAEDTEINILYETVRDRVLAADSSQHDSVYVEQMASREHVVPAIEGALKKFGAAYRPRKTKLHKDLTSHYKANPISVEEAQKQLEAQVASLF